MSTAPRMDGKVCLVTGANSGLGKETAIGLARLGAHVVAVSRDQGRGEAAVADIGRQSGSEKVELMLCDLASQASIRAFAEAFKKRHPKLHVLVNNAGLLVNERQTTPDGYEQTFALNHLGYFLLANLLLDTLQASAPARVVNVASETQRLGHLDFDDLMFERRAYSPMKAYCQSKLANVVFTYELARRLAGSGVTVNCLHPGAVSTGFGSGTTGLFGFAMQLARPFMLTAQKGADTAVWLASAPEVEGITGQYYAKRRPIRSNKESYDERVWTRLWDVSAQLTHLA